MVISSEKGKIEFSDGVLAELVGQLVRDSIGVSEMSPKNLTENLVARLGFDGRQRGVSLKQSGEGLIVELRMQFWSASGIAAYVAELDTAIRELLESRLGITVYEVHVDVVGIAKQ